MIPFRVKAVGFKLEGLGFGLEGLELRVQGIGFAAGRSGPFKQDFPSKRLLKGFQRLSSAPKPKTLNPQS